MWAAAVTVQVIEGMNEIYVASEKHESNSDTVFYMQHIDGPWYLMPFCGAYRCILAVNENKCICTAFPQVRPFDLQARRAARALCDLAASGVWERGELS